MQRKIYIFIKKKLKNYQKPKNYINESKNYILFLKYTFKEDTQIRIYIYKKF